MKMPRSHCENENLQFVQELAEVDGPFESPININFKDLTKLDLPSLIWNRSDACPKKMKITNTGHTVIVSGKWKCERPYLTGGPLLGKYVFSQIHFHWGQDDCRGSEHLVCGEGFPLEMHVAHFKTDYINQECALKERDGMVILVYLFKLQDEPNVSLKKILNCLPNIRQANTSQQLDPKPILSLCNPFTDDYFMYWGSVVTSTCAHILMWLVCREPFGISKDQVCEFRKILDSSQQPICRNNRETQPLHKRNVFHVNASKNLDCPLLPVKKIVGCFCGKGNEDNESIQSTKDCCCRGSVKDQEDVQDREPKCQRMAPQPQEFHFHQSLFVQRATVQSAPLLPKFFENTQVRQLWPNGSTKETEIGKDGNVKFVSQSCCFIVKDIGQVQGRQEKRRSRQSSFNSMKALSHIMESLEALKKHTRKRLKEIDLINQEIKGIKSFYDEPEDKKWFKKLEKIMSRQKEITSYDCLSEIKKLAKECNIDQFFESKLVSLKNSNKFWLNKISAERDFMYFKSGPAKNISKKKSKSFTIDKAIKFSGKAQKLIQSFFVDIKESEGFQKNLKKNLNLKEEKSNKSILSNTIESKEESKSYLNVEKGRITKKMFNKGKLEDRFFIEVKSEEAMKPEEMDWTEPYSQTAKLFVSVDGSQEENQNETESYSVTKESSEERRVLERETRRETIIPLHRVDIPVGLSDIQIDQPPIDNVTTKNKIFEMDDIEIRERFLPTNFSDAESLSSFGNVTKENLDSIKQVEVLNKKDEKYLSVNHLNQERLLTDPQNLLSDSSTESASTQQIILAKLHKRQVRKEVQEQRLITAKSSSKGSCNKRRDKKQKVKNINFEGYFIKKKNFKSKKRKIRKVQNGSGLGVSSEFSSRSKDLLFGRSEHKWKNLTKARFKLKIEKTSDSTIESAVKCSRISLNKKIINSAKTSLTQNDIGSEGSAKTFEQNVDSYEGENTVNDLPSDLHLQQEATKESQKTFDCDELTNKSVEQIKTENFETSLRKSPAMETKNTSTGSVKNFEGIQKIKNVELSEPTKLDSPIFRRTMRNRSFTSVSIRFKNNSTETKKRIFVQTNEDRCNLVQDFLDFKQFKTFDVNREISLEPLIKPIFKESSKMEGEEIVKDEKFELSRFNVGFLTTSRQKQSGKLLSETYIQEGTNEMFEKLNIKSEKEKYCPLDGETQENNTTPMTDFTIQEEKKVQENLPKVESNKSLASMGADMKGDANSPGAETVELLSTPSYTNVKNKSRSRPRSFENLTSPLKMNKRKRKKRPHCSNRVSRHYIRKNSCVFGKPDKVDNKPLNFLNLSAEEQLKIISMNVAKYLKQKYIEKERDECDVDVKKKESTVEEIGQQTRKEKIPQLKKTGTMSYLPRTIKIEIPKSEKIPSENGEETVKGGVNQTVETKQTIPIQSTEAQNLEKVPATEKTEEKFPKVEEITQGKAGKENSKTKKPVSPRPPLNFIKLNKLMAGKYRRSNATEAKSENSEGQKKTEELKKTMPKGKTQMNKNSNRIEESESKKSGNSKIDVLPKSGDKTNKRTTNTNESKGSDFKKCSKNSEKNGPPKQLPKPREKQEVSREANQEFVTDENPTVNTESDQLNFNKYLPLGKTPSTLVPAYMMTSYVTPSIDMPESQQNLNQLLLNVKRKKINTYLPDVLYDSQNYNDVKGEVNETIFAKDLENLIKLQMCLNNEIAANIENSMNYIKTLISQDYNGNAIVEKAPVKDTIDYYDSSQNGIVLIEMNDLMDCSTSSSECREELENCSFLEDENSKKFDFQVKKIINANGGMPNDYGDRKIINPVFVQDLADPDEEYYSDSSYNCEILITLNGSTKDISEIQNLEPGSHLQEYPIPSVHLLKRESNSSQLTTTHLEKGHSSQSIILKPIRKKRKENEISVEMKKKLLEILEGEIRREMALSYQGSSENSTDALTLVWDESLGTNKSQSLLESSSDNTEVLAQISETMRQYLSEYKKRRMVKKKLDVQEKNRREDDF